MKTYKSIILLFTLLLSAQLVSAQLRANLYGAYVFDDKFDSYYDNSNYYNGKIKGGFQGGLGLEYIVKEYYGIELLYLRQNTTAPVDYQNGYATPLRHDELDVAMNYILLAFGRSVTAPSGKVEGFLKLMAGAGIAEAQNTQNESGSVTKFAWGAKLGGIIWASDAIGIKLQAQLTSPVQATGGGLYFGTGGAGAGVSAYSTVYQFALGGGLTFKLQK